MCVSLFVCNQRLFAQDYWDGTADCNFNGSGTENNPYLISTPEQLAGMAIRVSGGEDFYGKYFRLIQDIYLTDYLDPDTVNWKEWVPIGGICYVQDGHNGWKYTSDTCYFRGTFDGNDHTVYNLYHGHIPNIKLDDLDDPTYSYVPDFTGWYKGLFGFVKDGTIKNLNMYDARMSGARRMGIIASIIYSGTVTNCTVNSGYVYANDGGAGAIAGENEGIIENCYVNSNVIASRGAGAVAGYNGGVIRNTHAKGISHCTEYFVGGLVGSNFDTGLIEKCWADVEVSRGGYIYNTNPDAGGFVGDNQGTIRECWCTGDVYGSFRHGAGGFCGRNRKLIESCYSTGNVYGDGLYGAASFVNENGYLSDYNGYLEISTPGVCINCFSTGASYNSDTMEKISSGSFLQGICSEYYDPTYTDDGLNSSRTVNCVFNIDSVATPAGQTFGGALGYTTAFMKSRAFVERLNMVAALCGTSTWEYREGDYPVPTGVKATNIKDYLGGGSGTVQDPFIISNKTHLENFRTYVNNGWDFRGQYILQDNDIELNAPFEQWGIQAPVEWVPIGCHWLSLENSSYGFEYSFRGTYDGGFHEVRNMYIDNQKGLSGLFGTLRSHAVIKNLGVTDAYVTTSGNNGILVGNVQRYARFVTISQCWTSGMIEGGFGAGAMIGGIALEGNVNILNCSSSADVYGGDYGSAVVGDENYIGGVSYSNDTVGNYLFTGILNSGREKVLPMTGRERHFNGYYDNELFQWVAYNGQSEEKNADDQYNKLGRNTEYLQGKDMVNIFNGWVDDWNSNHSFKLDYWEWTNREYPSVSPSFVPPLTVSFNSNGGTAITDKRVLMDSHIPAPARPVRDGYIFGGWYKDPDCKQLFLFDETPVTASCTLYAKWITPVEYDLTPFNNKFATTFHISTKEQLYGLAVAVKGIEGERAAMTFEGKKICLDNDIFLNDTADWKYWGKYSFAQQWTPIGDWYDEFCGDFDGQGHTVYGMYRSWEESWVEQYVGLFGYVGNSSVAPTIERVGVEASVLSVNNTNYVGLLVGDLGNGTVSQCYASGIINGRGTNHVGGLIGILGEYSSRAYCGSVIDCYARLEGDVIYYSRYSDGVHMGGLIGCAFYPTSSITNCYASGDVVSRLTMFSTVNNGCGLIVNGTDDDDSSKDITVTSSYYNRDIMNNKGVGTARSTDEMHLKSYYTDWDFNEIWGRSDTINDGYPYLRCMYGELIPDDQDPIVVTGITMLEATPQNQYYPLSLNPFDTIQLHVNVLPADAYDKTVIWTSSDTTVAVVTDSGLVIPRFRPDQAGKAFGVSITATTRLGNYSVTCRLSVNQPGLTRVLNGTYREKCIGDEKWGMSTGYYSVNSQLEYGVYNYIDSLFTPVTWTSSNPDVAVVEVLSNDTLVRETYDAYAKYVKASYIIIKGVSAGKTTITGVDEHGSTYSLNLTYQVYDPEGINLSQVKDKMNIGDSVLFKTTPLPRHASYLPRLQWRSTNESVLSVNQNGMIKALGEGTADVVITSSDFENVYAKTITVNSIPVSSVDIYSDGFSGTLMEGDSVQFHANVYPQNASYKDLVWSSSDTTVATVDQNGLVKAVNGSYDGIDITISATSRNGKVAERRVKVRRYKVTLNDNLDGDRIRVGDRWNYSLSVEPRVDNLQFTFESSDTTVFTVNNDGNAFAIGVGSAELTAMAIGFDTIIKASVNVEPVIASSISIKVDGQTPEKIYKGDTIHLYVDFYPSNTTDKTVIWRSSDTTIAIVDQSGVVVPLMGGYNGNNVSIYAESNGRTASMSLKVWGARIQMSNYNRNMGVGEQQQLSYTVSPDDREFGVAWTSSDTTVLKITDSGLITAISPGSATVTGTVDGSTTKFEATITVSDIEVEEITIKADDDNDGWTLSDAIFEGETRHLCVSVSPNNATDKSVKWISSDTTIAKVDADGYVTAVQGSIAGESVRISAQSKNGESDAVNLLIKKEGVMITAYDSVMTAGNKSTLTVISAQKSQGTPIIITSSNPNVVSVSNYTLNALSEGVVMITVTMGNYSDSCKIRVQLPAITGLKLNTTWVGLYVGESTQLVASLTPSILNGKEKIVWENNNPSAVTVDANGLVRAIGVGIAEITAKAGGFQATCIIAVDYNVTFVTLNAKNVTLEEGQTFQLVATIRPDSISEKVGKYWESSDQSIVTVDNNGLVRGVSAKLNTWTNNYTSANIKLYVGPQIATCTVTVVPATSGIESINADIEGGAAKTIENGQLIFTLPDGRKFNSAGIRIE